MTSRSRPRSTATPTVSSARRRSTRFTKHSPPASSRSAPRKCRSSRTKSTKVCCRSSTATRNRSSIFRRAMRRREACPRPLPGDRRLPLPRTVLQPHGRAGDRPHHAHQPRRCAARLLETLTRGQNRRRRPRPFRRFPQGVVALERHPVGPARFRRTDPGVPALS